MAGVIPAEELLGGGIISSLVKVLEQGGMGEPGDAEVEGEVDECVKLALRERDFDELFDGSFGFLNVPLEDDAGLFFRDAVGVKLWVNDTMAVADGGVTRCIQIGLPPKAFRLFQDCQSRRAELHAAPSQVYLDLS